MAILIAGGKGFIGAQMIPKLLAQGEEIVCLEPRDTPGRLADLASRLRMTVGSVANMDDVMRVFRDHSITKVAGMVFFAFREDPDRLHDEMSIMVQGTANLFEAARLHGVKRVVFPSSIAYYGPQSLHGDGNTALDEDAPCLARSLYGIGKRLCEVLADDYNRHAGMDIVSMRIPVVYGPGGRVGSRGVNLIATQGVAQGRVVLPHAADEKVLIGHVVDVAQAGVRLLRAERLAHRAYNVGGHTLSFEDIATIGRQITPGLEVDYRPQASSIELPYLIDNARIAAELGVSHRPPVDAYRELAALARRT